MRKKLIQKSGAVCCLLIGCILLLYPWISSSRQESRAVSTVAEYKKEKELYKTAMAEARRCAQTYNAALMQEAVVLTDPFRADRQEGRQELYDRIRKEIGREILGSLEIPALQLKLPVYMGTTEAVLQQGAGHLEGTSLPVGGENTHAVLTGHTGLHTAKLFTDLETLVEGDLFRLDILGEQMTYRVEQILVVTPEDTEALRIQKGRDLVTLLTCTPYGVNDHRLLIRGVRVGENTERQENQPEKHGSSRWLRAYVRALGCGGIALLLLWVLTAGNKKEKMNR